MNRKALAALALAIRIAAAGAGPTSAAASPAASPAPHPPPTPGDGLPPWLSHVDDAFLRRNLDLARARHDAAVRAATEGFDTDGAARSAPAERDAFLRSMRFDEYNIVAEGYRLPDFHDELGDKSVFVTRRDTPMFTKEECDNIVSKAEAYYSSVDENGVQREWPTLPSGQYYIQGFWIKEGPPEIKEWFVRMVKTRLFETLNHQFPDFCEDIENLVVDNAYMFKYTAAPGLRTEIHTDAGCLSFTFALNSNSEYKGGGTYVEGLTKVGAPDNDGDSDSRIIEMDVGQCTVRPAGLRHGGNPLESGVRYIIGGFCMHKRKVEAVRMLMDNPPTADGALVKEALQAAIALNPRCDLPYPTLARIYEEEGDPKSALSVVKDCLAIANPNSASASYYLGTMSYRAGQYDKAVECMNICLGVDEKDGDAMQTLYQSYAKLGKSKEELGVLNRIVDTPGVSRRVLANAYCNLGTMCDDVDAEMDYYLKAIDFNPSSSSTWHSLGSALASQGSWGRAVAAYKKSIELIGSGGGEVGVEDAVNTVEQKKETLGLLYRAALQQVRTEAGASGAPLSRDAMVGMLIAKMGDENYRSLASLSRA